jgi:DNA repair exonuclease SbcCD ATPase subunit
MELRELRVQQLPGLEHPFTLTAAAGLNLVLGPNGSGKSSLCRAALGLLWPGLHEGGQVAARWDDAGATWLAERAGGARVAWQREGLDSSPPDLPSVALAGAFHLGVLDILKVAADGDDQALARAVRRQMAGGFDLPGLIAGAVVTGKEGYGERRELVRLESIVKEKQQAQRDLFGQEQGLDDLRARYLAAHQAAGRARALRAARDLTEARARSAGLADQLASRYPACLADLRPEHVERLARLRDRQRDLDDARTATRADLDAATADLAATGLAGTPPDPVDLAAARDAMVRARQLDDDLIAAEDALARAEAQAAAAEADLAGWGGQATHAVLDAATLRAAVRRVQDLLTATSLHDGLARLAAHEELQLPPPGADPTADVVAARRAALAWLGAAAERHWPWPALPAAVALLVAGILVRPWAADPLGWVWLGVGAGVLGWFLVDGLRRPATRRARDDHRASGVGQPAVWQAGAVHRHVDQLLEQELALAHDARRQALRRRLEADLDAARSALDDLRRSFDSDDADPGERAELTELSRRLAAHQQARLDRDQAAVAADRLRTRRQEALDAVHGALAGWLPDADPDDGPLALPTLEARVVDLARRATAHADATRRHDAARRRLEDLAAQADQTVADIAALLASQDLPPDGDQELRRRAEELPAYAELAGQARDAAADVRRHQDTLAQLTDDLRALAEAACTLPADQLGDQLADAEDLAANRDELQRQVLVIEERLKAAYRAVDHDRAITERDVARDRLADVRDSVRGVALRRLLLERLDQQHRRLAEPPVVARARQLFSGFTHGAYELLIPADDHEPYRARDTRSGRGLALSQLSDGTRAQLLLAARLAHVAEAERGVQLPLFLDEALTASDPARFDAVANALLDLAQREGRQLFYLTCDPADIQAWQRLLDARGLAPAPVTDLARLRGLAVAAPVERLRGERSRPPAPHADEAAAAYAARLGVPVLDPHAPASAAHLAYLLDDDLALLHQLLCRGIERLGQFMALDEVLLADGVIDAPRLAAVHARRRALQEFLDAFVTGRGRAAPPGVLARDCTVKTSKLGDVDTLLAELGGDAAALGDAMAAGRISRLQEAKQDELMDWLRQAGYLDTRRRLTRDEVATRVLLAGRDDVDQGRVSMPDLQRLVHTWWGAAGGAVG